MPQLTINVNGHSYSVACEAGEEERLQSLGEMVDDRVSRLTQQFGQLGENKLLLMGALLLADELLEQQSGNGQATEADSNGAAAGAIESAAARIEDIVARLERD